MNSMQFNQNTNRVFQETQQADSKIHIKAKKRQDFWKRVSEETCPTTDKDLL